jgi:hypothetical protein
MYLKSLRLLNRKSGFPIPFRVSSFTQFQGNPDGSFGGTFIRGYPVWLEEA